MKKLPRRFTPLVFAFFMATIMAAAVVGILPPMVF